MCDLPVTRRITQTIITGQIAPAQVTRIMADDWIA